VISANTQEPAGGRCFCLGHPEQEHRPPAGSYARFIKPMITSSTIAPIIA
jgi:hypothetical protein